MRLTELRVDLEKDREIPLGGRVRGYPDVNGPSRFRAFLHRSFSWVSCLRFAAALGGLAIINLFLPADVGSAVRNPMGAAAVIAIGLGAHRAQARRAWNAIVAGIGFYALGDLAGAIVPAGQTQSPTGMALATSVLILASYSCLAAGITFMLVDRRSR
jgi:hypothetical protein